MLSFGDWIAGFWGGWGLTLLDLLLFLLVKHGGDVNATDNIQQTALHWVAVRGAIAVADVLLQNGARVEAVDVNGYRVILSFFLVLFLFLKKNYFSFGIYSCLFWLCIFF
jgi:hypothetical protein